MEDVFTRWETKMLNTIWEFLGYVCILAASVTLGYLGGSLLHDALIP